MADRVAGFGAACPDGTAMSGTRPVGDPSALFGLSDSADAFAAHRAVLAAPGNSAHLGVLIMSVVNAGWS